MYIYLHMDINFACASRYIFAYMYKFPCAYTYIYMFSYTCQISLFCLETGRWLGPARSYLGWVFFLKNNCPSAFSGGPTHSRHAWGTSFKSLIQVPIPPTPPHPPRCALAPLTTNSHPQTSRGRRRSSTSAAPRSRGGCPRGRTSERC